MLKINKQVVVDRYNRYGANYDEHARQMGSKMDGVVLDYLEHLVFSDSYLLDVAGGSNYSLSKLDPKKVSIVSMDISSELLRVGSQRYSNVIKTVHGDFDNVFPFSDSTFDFVTCISALEFSADIHFTLKEMVRVTKAGGVLLFTTDRFDPDNPIQAERIHIYDPNGFFSCRYKTDEVLEHLASLDVTVERLGTHPAFQLEEKWVNYDLFLVRKSG